MLPVQCRRRANGRSAEPFQRLGTPFADRPAQHSRGADMALGDDLFGVHGKALALRSQRLGLLASNIANASTPGFKAKDIDFSETLAAAEKPGTSVSSAIDAATKFRVPLQPSLDGNTVELNTEQTK